MKINNLNITFTKRRLEIDVLKFVAIFLVLMGHCILHLSSDDAFSNPLYSFISSFHMPLFMMASGFFCAGSLKLNFFELLKKKFKQLIYPCLIFGVLFFIIDWTIYATPLKKAPGYLFEILWFLKSNFLCYIITFLCFRICKGHQFSGILLAIIISQLIPFFKINWMLPFFLTGYLLSLKYEEFLKHKNLLFCISLVVFIVLFSFYDLSSNELNGLKRSLMAGEYGIITEIAKIQLFRYAIGLAGAMMTWTIISIITEWQKDKKYINKLGELGKLTLGIYIIHTLVLCIMMGHAIDLSGLDILFFSLCIVPLLSFAVMDICIELFKLIQGNDFLNNLFFLEKSGETKKRLKSLNTEML